MEELAIKINLLKRRLYVVYILWLTLYIAAINSYALFSLYPAVKQESYSGYFVTISIYLLLISPLILIAYTKRKSTGLKVLIIGLGAMGAAILVRYMIEPAPLLELTLHAIIYLITGFCEEYLWRGVLWKTVFRKTNSTLYTILIVTIHFTILHIPFALLRTESALLFLGQVFILGLTLGIVRHYAKNIRTPAFMHAIVNMINYS